MIVMAGIGGRIPGEEVRRELLYFIGGEVPQNRLVSRYDERKGVKVFAAESPQEKQGFRPALTTAPIDKNNQDFLRPHCFIGPIRLESETELGDGITLEVGIRTLKDSSLVREWGERESRSLPPVSREDLQKLPVAKLWGPGLAFEAIYVPEESISSFLEALKKVKTFSSGVKNT